MQTFERPESYDGWQQDSNGWWWNMDGSGAYYIEPDSHQQVLGYTHAVTARMNSERSLVTTAPDLQTRHERSYLTDMFESWGPLPPEALVLGTAYEQDRLPVLLNLHDDVPGPILILGDHGNSLTNIQRVAAASAIYHHEPETINFSAITTHPSQFLDLYQLEVPHKQPGIFSSDDPYAAHLIEGMATWIQGMRETPSAANILLIDDPASLLAHHPDIERALQYILLRGPKKRVWPIVTVQTNTLPSVYRLLKQFHTRIYGKITSKNVIQGLGIGDADVQLLDREHEFTIREGDHWLPFSAPFVNKEALMYELEPARHYTRQELRHISAFARSDEYLRRHPHVEARRIRRSRK